MTVAAWKILLRIAEQPHAQMSGTALRRACGGGEPSLVRLGALIRTPGGAAGPLILAHDSDDDAFEDGHEHHVVDAGSRVAVAQPTADPHLYRLNIDWLLRALARSLGIKRALLTAELLPDLLWRLGGLTVGSREPIFFLARRLFHGDNFAKVRAELSAMLGQQPFVVLITAPAGQELALPAGLRLISLHDCAWLDSEGVQFDQERVSEVVRTAFAAPEEMTNFWHSPTYDQVRLGGMTFKLSPNRRQAVRKLHQASKTDDPWVEGKLLVQGKMVDAFKGLKPDWRLLIESDERGKYRLRASLPESLTSETAHPTPAG
jgi:hypothetical protein